MYQPTLARFTARDPLPQEGPVLMGRIPGNTYAYAESNPVNRMDPSGMDSTLNFSNQGGQACSQECPFLGRPFGKSIDVLANAAQIAHDQFCW